MCRRNFGNLWHALGNNFKASRAEIAAQRISLCQGDDSSQFQWVEVSVMSSCAYYWDKNWVVVGKISKDAGTVKVNEMKTPKVLSPSLYYNGFIPKT